MDNNYIKIASPVNPNAIARIFPGHFITTHSHINRYVDMTMIKSRKSEASAAASVLAREYSSSTYVDTIICMEGTEVIGAYLADCLTESGIMSINQHKTMYIATPEVNNGGQLIFRDNMTSMIKNKHCILLCATATTGRTVARAVECIKYFGGIVEGVSAIFSFVDSVFDIKINSIFNGSSVPGYESYEAFNCPLCKQGQALDAIVNSYGYSKL